MMTAHRVVTGMRVLGWIFVEAIFALLRAEVICLSVIFARFGDVGFIDLHSANRIFCHDKIP